MTTELATKSDLKELRGWATAEFADVRGELRTEFAKVREEMRTGHAQLRLEIAQSKTETVRWMIGLFVAQTTVTLGALLRLVGCGRQSSAKDSAASRWVSRRVAQS